MTSKTVRKLHRDIRYKEGWKEIISLWQSHSYTVPKVENATFLFQNIGEEQFVMRFVAENGNARCPNWELLNTGLMR